MDVVIHRLWLMYIDGSFGSGNLSRSSWHDVFLVFFRFGWPHQAGDSTKRISSESRRRWIFFEAWRLQVLACRKRNHEIPWTCRCQMYQMFNSETTMEFMSDKSWKSWWWTIASSAVREEPRPRCQRRGCRVSLGKWGTGLWPVLLVKMCDSTALIYGTIP